MSKLAKALSGAAGNAAGDPLYVEDVFSTYVYNGNGSNRNIVNGVDLTKDGLVWTKARSNAIQHELFDTERGIDRRLVTSSAAGEYYEANSLSGFNSNGFSLSTAGNTNGSAVTYASWSFRKAEKFFDVVKVTASGSTFTFSHNLGAVPAFIISKQSSGSGSWYTYHQSLGTTKYLQLNETNAAGTFSLFTNITSTSVTYNGLANTGQDYVFYLFASDAGGYGDDGDENIVKCGTYTGAGANLNINVGFEPQFVLIKSSSNATNWVMFDTMRGLPVEGNAKDLRPNTTEAEADNPAIGITSTGFLARNGMDGQINANGYTYIYMAIRMPMKTPEVGTEVLGYNTGGSASANNGIATGITTDFGFLRQPAATDGMYITSRLTGDQYMYAHSTAAEAAQGNMTWDRQTGFWKGNLSSYSGWGMKRAAGFMDVVCFTGDSGNTNQRVLHNLTVAPELIIYKGRNKVNYWRVYAGRIDQYTVLNLNNAVTTWPGFWGTSAPTTTDFGFNPNLMDLDAFNAVAYLFATLAGVSKVGSYTATGADLNVDCGFTASARFILIKRTDSTGDWYLFDALNGISVGNDPYNLLNTSAANVTGTDYIDPLNAGFTVTSSASSTINVNGGTYIFLAIA